MGIKHLIKTSVTVLLTSGFLGCAWIEDMPAERTYEEKFVINGLLIAGTRIDSSALSSSIRVHRSADITEPYDERSVVLSDVVVTLDDGDTVYSLQPYWVLQDLSSVNSGSLPGSWFHPTLLIQEGVTYTIRVSDDDHDPASAVTIVPTVVRISDIMVEGAPRDSIGAIVYRPARGDTVGFLVPTVFTFQMSLADPENPPAMVRIVNTALEASPSSMIIEDDTSKAIFFKWGGWHRNEVEQRIYFRQTTIFNSVNVAGEMKIGWTFVTFYGWQNLTVFALDEAYYDYHKGNLDGPPSDPNYLHESNVVDGYGLFASANLGVPPEVSSMNWRLLRPDGDSSAVATQP